MIKRIKIRDFKSIRELELELEPVTVLIGRSGTGKSNIVQALRFLRNLLLNYDEAISYEFGWERIVPVGEPMPKTAIEVWFSVPGEDREFSYRIGFGVPADGHFSGQLLLKEERLSLGTESLFSRVRRPQHDWKWERVPSISPPPLAQGERPILGQFPALQHLVFAHAVLSTGIGYYHFPATALARGNSDARGQVLFREMPGLSDSAENYLRVILSITQNFNNPSIRRNILASLREINPGIASVELDSVTTPQRAIIGHKTADLTFGLSLDQESDGLRRFYAHLLALYQTPSKLTLVFEEPENAIFPGALSLLADEFNSAPRENRGQVILTTHNPILLDAFDVDSLRAVELRDGKTVVGPIAKEQSDAVKAHLLTTGELLTTDRARLAEAEALQPA